MENSTETLINKAGWDYIKIEGSPENRGIQHGRLLASRILQCIDREKQIVLLNTGLDWSFFKATVTDLWASRLKNVTSQYHEFYLELLGIEKGIKQSIPSSKIDWIDLLTWNAYEELLSYWFPTKAQEIYRNMSGSSSLTNTQNAITGKNFQVGSADHCSAFIATGSYTEDGKIVVAHNSFVPFETASAMNVIIDMTTEKGERMIMQSLPGFIHSMTDFYVNHYGLIITETTIGGFVAYNQDGMLECIRARKAAQEAKTLDDFVNIFWKDNTGGYANTWLVGDTKTNQIMQFEAGCKFFNKQILSDGYFVGFNAPQDPKIRNFETVNSGYQDIRRHQGARQVRLPQLMEEYKGKLNFKNAQNILADHFDVYLNKDNPCSRTVCSHYELDAREYMSQPGRPVPFRPQGAIDGVICTSAMASKFELLAKFGSSCNSSFCAPNFFAQHPQFKDLEGLIDSRPNQKWTVFPPKS